MKIRSPIYNLFHQEIKACVDHLLEVCQSKTPCVEKDAEHILGRMQDLHQFACKVRHSEHYHALYALKHYLENTMLLYLDGEKKHQSMRLSEALSLLNVPSHSEMQFQPEAITSLSHHFVRHFQEEAKPGRPLFKNLSELRKL